MLDGQKCSFSTVLLEKTRLHELVNQEIQNEWTQMKTVLNKQKALTVGFL